MPAIGRINANALSISVANPTDLALLQSIEKVLSTSITCPIILAFSVEVINAESVSATCPIVLALDLLIVCAKPLSLAGLTAIGVIANTDWPVSFSLARATVTPLILITA